MQGANLAALHPQQQHHLHWYPHQTLQPCPTGPWWVQVAVKAQVLWVKEVTRTQQHCGSSQLSQWSCHLSLQMRMEILGSRAQLLLPPLRRC
jgi:hypothetical protein